MGIYGLRGAGRTELLECLFGVHPNATGTILVNGKKVGTHFIDKRIKSGISLIPEDRQREGIFQNLSISSNMSMASLKNYTNVFQLDSKKEAENVNNQVKNLSIKLADIKNLISSLSGGNQQKVIVGKSLLTSPKILLMDEPTRGIDVGAKYEIYNLMNGLAKEGVSIIMISSELPEILSMSDRIIVIHEGVLKGELTKEEATGERVMYYATGGKVNGK